jgi:hypothetical protein
MATTSAGIKELFGTKIRRSSMAMHKKKKKKGSRRGGKGSRRG